LLLRPWGLGAVCAWLRSCYVHWRITGIVNRPVTNERPLT
jgi:hypothetical protein